MEKITGNPRIALFLPHLAGGGAEKIAINTATNFRQRGLDVDIVLAYAEGQFLKDIPAGARLIDLHARRTLLAIPGLRRYLIHEHPDVIISSPNRAGLILLWSKLFTKVPTHSIVKIDNQISSMMINTPKLQEKLFPFLLRLFHRGADAIVAVSSGVADDVSNMAHIPRNRIRVIYNPILSPEIIERSKEPVDHPWFAPEAPPVILAVGRLAPQKDYPTLLRAFAHLRSKRPARLMILGEGDQRDELTKLAAELGISEHISMPGFDPNPYRFMANCNVFASSSAWEGLPTVLIEALACGAQIAATDCPSGPAEILEGGKYGRLVQVGNAAALGDAIEVALDDPMPTDMLREQANKFSVDIATEEYLRLISVLGK